MATAGLKRQRLTLEVTFASENDKKMFQDKLAAAKRLLLPPHRRDACSFLNAMLDRILVPTGTYDASTPPVLPPAGSSFLDTSGVFTGDQDPDDQKLFVVEKKCFNDLCQGLTQHCSCMCFPSWQVTTFIQVRLIHAFTCAGMLPQQFVSFCNFAGIGQIKKHYMHTMYNRLKYRDVVKGIVETSMQDAIENVKALPDYVDKGEGDHSGCPSESLCCLPGYRPQKQLLSNSAAISALKSGLKRTSIYRYAEHYSRCRDTYWIESFNHQLLTYLCKGVHFGEETFAMRMNLAVLDWNENVRRAVTSERHYLNARRPDRHAPSRVLVEKTFTFVQNIWETYVHMNQQSTLAVCGKADFEIDEDPMLQPGMECEDGEILNEDDDEWDVGEVCEEAYEDMENL
ncbi:hypothetical protein EMCRGX_G005238 [Ephydatia muelleri]